MLGANEFSIDGVAVVKKKKITKIKTLSWILKHMKTI